MASKTVSLSPAIVTGGCGFTGSHMVDGLLKHDENVQVHVMARNVRNQIPGVTYHKCDISSLQQVQAVLEKVKPKTIFHVASPDSTVLQPDMFWKVNVGGARNLLEACKKVDSVQAFVYTSSSSIVHTNSKDAIDIDESLPILRAPAQKRIYTLTKAEAEIEILAANRANGDHSMLTVSIRPSGIFGERDLLCAGKIIANARQGKAGYQFGSGKNVYDFVYISNLIDAHILAAEHLVRDYGKPVPDAGTRVDGECFNITNDEPVLFWEFSRALAASVDLPVAQKDIKVIPFWLAFMMAAVTEWATWALTGGKKQPIVTRDAVRNSTMSRTLNGAKARKVLGYRPKVNMEEGLARTGKWFKEQAETRGVDAKNDHGSG